MDISLIIPTLRIGDWLNKAIKSMEGEYDELIIIDDKIDNLAKKINKGLRMASGKHLVVANDDVQLTRGHLYNLCSNGVLSPFVNDSPNKPFHAHLFCLPRKIYGEIGGYYEGYNGFYYDDSDYCMKLLRAGYIPNLNPDVNINHPEPATTLKTFPQRNDWERENQQLFIKRWGVEALNIVR
jgi:glycosyltransferase involved in cell wall biosynthesis